MVDLAGDMLDLPSAVAGGSHVFTAMLFQNPILEQLQICLTSCPMCLYTTNTRSSIRGKLVFHYKRTSVGRHYYFNRLVRLWNALPEVNLGGCPQDAAS